MASRLSAPEENAVTVTRPAKPAPRTASIMSDASANSASSDASTFDPGILAEIAHPQVARPQVARLRRRAGGLLGPVDARQPKRRHLDPVPDPAGQAG